jgi:vacuolar-type H+-ATPase subunit E/Vma4
MLRQGHDQQSTRTVLGQIRRDTFFNLGEVELFELSRIITLREGDEASVVPSIEHVRKRFLRERWVKVSTSNRSTGSSGFVISSRRERIRIDNHID